MVMRWILALLVAANIGYFVYHGWFGPVDADVKPEKEPVATSGERIQLLDEAIARGNAVRATNPQPGVTEVPVRRAQLCTQIGAFQAQETAGQVQQRLMSASIGSEIKEVKVPTAPDYWVFIPPLPSRDMALRKLRSLQASKIDSFIITEGELANGISLGLFTQRAHADKLLKQRLAAGYEAELKEVERFQSEYWIEVRREDRELLSKELWEGIHSRYGFAEKVDNLCDTTVARPGEFQ
ncbi:SPOR domain-containing protein [Parendozoicomonas haliclonae]|uniref:Sporulation related domain protein n=1 Tax=Parendozoicomonas haliclonae TaxID=1960125 RepID=A0A1X7AN85_9GAMM|nr:SPOR domain-containing protein [Parendozoicomonas haliclonae]SMA49745.1 Sporulation related domain protein [Parendozoicomonas haliclonae]